MNYVNTVDLNMNFSQIIVGLRNGLIENWSLNKQEITTSLYGNNDDIYQVYYNNVIIILLNNI